MPTKRSRRRAGRLARRRGDLQRLLVGAERCVQPAPGTLDLAEVMAALGGQGSARPPPATRRCWRRRRARPPRPGRAATRPRPVATSRSSPASTRPRRLGQGLRSERGRAFGVAVELGQGGAFERDRRGDVHQQARGPADRRLEWLIGGIAERALRGVQRRPGRFQSPPASAMNACARHSRGRDRTSSAGSAASHRSTVAPSPRQKSLVDVPLDQPRGPGRIPGGQRVADGVVGEPMLLTPGRRVPVQRRTRPGCSCRSRARSRSANRWW